MSEISTSYSSVKHAQGQLQCQRGATTFKALTVKMNKLPPQYLMLGNLDQRNCANARWRKTTQVPLISRWPTSSSGWLWFRSLEWRCVWWIYKDPYKWAGISTRTPQWRHDQCRLQHMVLVSMLQLISVCLHNWLIKLLTSPIISHAATPNGFWGFESSYLLQPEHDTRG